MRIGLQLYTLRELTAEDMGGVLNQVSEMGYQGVELAGFGNLDAEDFSMQAKAKGITVISAHVSLEQFQNDLPGWVSNAKKLGTNSLTLPYLPPEYLDEANIDDTARIINDLIYDLRTAGIVLSYHNHDFEFVDGRFDRLMAKCPYLQVELDTYWVKFAGKDPLKIMKKYARRITLIHLKDMQDKKDLNHEDANPVLTTGTMDIKSIVRKAEQMNVPWAIVEMDKTAGDPIEDVSASIENLKKLL